MTGTYQPYPEYRDTGNDWLPEIPDHWTCASFRHALNGIKNGSTATQVDEGENTVPISRIETISKGEVDFTKVGHVLNTTGLQTYKLNEGDILFSHINSLPMVGNVAQYLSDAPLYHGMNLLRLQASQKLDDRFLLWWLKSSFFRQSVEASAKPAINQASIGIEQLKSISCFYPALSEQQTIAAFLDYETARIDQLIAKQQRLIELLKEKILALALTSFDQSEAQQSRLAHISDLVARPVSQEEGELYTPIGLFNRGRGLFHKAPREKEEMGDSDFFWVKEGDLILSGQFAWEGAVALAGQIEDNCVVSHRYPVLRGKEGIALTEYLYALFLTKHGDFLLNQNSRGAAGRNRPLNIRSLLKEKVPLPPMSTQQEVAKAVHWRVNVQKKLQRQLHFLQERRTALISAAVTGKIDLRGWVAPVSTKQGQDAA